MSLNKSLSMPKELITGQSAWYGRDLLDSTDWIKFFSQSEKLELDAAMRSVKEKKNKDRRHKEN